MRTIWLILVSFIVSMMCCAFASGEAQAFILEAAPLKAVGGDTSVAAEFSLSPMWGLRFGYDRTVTNGEHQRRLDERRRAAVGATFSPPWNLAQAMFFGAGLAYETVTLHRMALRDGTTWIRTNAEETYDTWQNHDTYVAAFQEIGLRLGVWQWLTASARLGFEQDLWRHSLAVAEELHSHQLPLASPGRSPVQNYVSVHLGLSIP